MDKLPLARDFPATDEAAWKTLVEKALKGAPFSLLQSKRYDGIAVEALYGRATNAQIIPGRAPGKPWEVLQRIEFGDGKLLAASLRFRCQEPGGYIFAGAGGEGDGDSVGRRHKTTAGHFSFRGGIDKRYDHLSSFLAKQALAHKTLGPQRPVTFDLHCLFRLRPCLLYWLCHNQKRPAELIS